MTHKILKSLLKRYQLGKATRAERFVVDIWYDSFANIEQKVPGLEDQHATSQTAKRIFGKIRIAKPWYYQRNYQVACSIALLLGSLFIYYAQPLDFSSENHAIVYQTIKGQTKKIMLKDSSLVWLNANSVIEVSPDYAHEIRNVKLTGEAYFEVRPNKQKPFIIAAQGTKTKVLGTSFNVSAYSNASNVTVTVRTGKVSVSDTHSTLAMLLPGKALRYDKKERKATLTDESPELAIGWRQGKVLVNDVPFGELSEIFNNTLGVKLVTRDKDINAMHFRLTLNTRKTLEENLALITGIHQLKYRRIGNNEIELHQ